jgi:dienelactone hydrolase
MIALLVLFLQTTPIDRYLEEKDKAARTRLLSEIKVPLAEVEAALRTPPKRGLVDAKGQIVKKRIRNQHPLGVEFEYVLWVPQDYSPDKTWRLIVSLHGQNGNGEQFIRNWLSDVQRDGATFLLCPSAGRGGWGNSLLGYHHVLDALRDVTATYAIDLDRVYLDGASMGGNGSFQFACFHPDLFAGVAPRSGGPLFRKTTKEDKNVTAEGLENLMATPLYWIIGAKDPEVDNAWVHVAKALLDPLKSDFTFKEFPDGGHEWFPQENAAVLAWMGAKKRDAYAPRVAIDTNERATNRNFWLEIAEFSGKENLKRGYKDLDGKVIEERTLFFDHAHAKAELLKESNEIKITATGAREIRVYLHETMVDYSKPLTVTVNASRSKLDLKPSLDTLLESARRDRGLLYTASVKVKVP